MPLYIYPLMWVLRLYISRLTTFSWGLLAFETGSYWILKVGLELSTTFHPYPSAGIWDHGHMPSLPACSLFLCSLPPLLPSSLPPSLQPSVPPFVSFSAPLPSTFILFAIVCDMNVCAHRHTCHSICLEVTEKLLSQRFLSTLGLGAQTQVIRLM